VRNDVHTTVVDGNDLAIVYDFVTAVGQHIRQSVSIDVCLGAILRRDGQ
jgi:hypothetical protein